jgi:hypothetical protein
MIMEIRNGRWVSKHSLRSGQSLRDEGMAAAERGESSYVLSVRKLILSWPSGKEYTADDVRAVIADPKQPNVIGSAVNRVSKQLAEVVGYTQSKSASRRGGILRIWRRI